MRTLERLQDSRVLEPWERYRALLDVLDAYTDLMEVADRKTRFEVAFTVQSMAAINTVKYRALERVYRGLVAQTALTALLLSALASSAFARQ